MSCWQKVGFTHTIMKCHKVMRRYHCGNLYARFEVKIPSARPVDISTLSEAEFNEELEKGYADMQAGRTKNAKKAFADIRKDYGL